MAYFRKTEVLSEDIMFAGECMNKNTFSKHLNKNSKYVFEPNIKRNSKMNKFQFVDARLQAVEINITNAWIESQLICAQCNTGRTEQLWKRL